MLAAAVARTGWRPNRPQPLASHYGVLGLACDHSEAELKRAYKKASITAHPDRPGGSTSPGRPCRSTLPLAAVDCHCFGISHSDRASIAAMFCQNDSIARC